MLYILHVCTVVSHIVLQSKTEWQCCKQGISKQMAQHPQFWAQNWIDTPCMRSFFAKPKAGSGHRNHSHWRPRPRKNDRKNIERHSWDLPSWFESSTPCVQLPCNFLKARPWLQGDGLCILCFITEPRTVNRTGKVTVSMEPTRTEPDWQPVPMKPKRTEPIIYRPKPNRCEPEPLKQKTIWLEPAVSIDVFVSRFLGLTAIFQQTKSVGVTTRTHPSIVSRDFHGLEPWQRANILKTYAMFVA